jgi:hypothetical protein
MGLLDDLLIPKHKAMDAKAVVACGERRWMFLFWSKGFDFDIEEGLDPDDVLDTKPLREAKRRGLVAWEGKNVPIPPGFEETHWEWQYRGAWRDLTADEWAAVQRGENPWRKTETTP